MTAMSIQLPDDLRSRLEARAAENGFTDLQTYVEAMLRVDAASGLRTDDEQLESMLLERLDGPFAEVDAADFRRMREKLNRRLDSGASG